MKVDTCHGVNVKTDNIAFGRKRNPVVCREKQIVTHADMNEPPSLGRHIIIAFF